MNSSEPGPVEAAVQDEISDLAAEARPGIAQAALALARNIMDDPRAANQQAAAAKVLGLVAGQAALGVGAWPSRSFVAGSGDDDESWRLMGPRTCTAQTCPWCSGRHADLAVI